ncbi:MAG TPA: sigma-70 family RNA polymerase sigma factor, partial [Nitrospinota bacterium]|nr:sigma-70 family RNA polymerase sigma factor [Nitrospinota bacterium]
MADNDIQLVKEMQAGKPEAFDEMVRSYQKRVYSLAYNLTHNQSDAEDVSQEVFLRVCNKINTFLGKAAFSSWVYRITLNVSFVKLKSRKKIKQV